MIRMGAEPTSFDRPGLWHSTIEHAPMPMVEVESARHIVRWVNLAFCRIVDKEGEEIVGKPFSEIVPEGDECLALLDRVYQTGEVETHIEPVRAEPNPFYWSFVMWPVRAAAEKPTGVVVQITETAAFHQQATEMNQAMLLAALRQHEVTEERDRQKNAQLQAEIMDRKQAEAALRESDRQFRQLANVMPQIVWTARPDGQIDYYNERWYEFTGFSRDEFRQTSWEKILHPDDVKRTVETYFGCIRTGQPYWIEYRFRDRATGGYRWFMGRALSFRNERDEIVKWFGTCTDIDDQKRAVQKLEQAVAERTAQLRETVGELESFSFSIAHDMRAPLRSLQGFSEVLLEEYGGKIDAVGQTYLRRIATSADRMDRLIQDVLNYSKVVRAELPLEPVDVEKLLRGMIETYPMFFPESADIQIQSPIPYVLGNEAALTQCLSNLLGNAVKFIAPGVKPIVRVFAETRDGHVRVFVQDNGIGISADQHEKIFEIFQQVAKSYQGTGIGLAIVKKAVERMNGCVGLESAPGQGSTFWIELQSV
jgi:PAS domain S-box-containing protein